MFRVAHNYQTKLEVSCDDFSGPSLPPGGSSSVSVNRVTLRVPPPRPTTMYPKPSSILIQFFTLLQYLEMELELLREKYQMEKG